MMHSCVLPCRQTAGQPQHNQGASAVKDRIHHIILSAALLAVMLSAASALAATNSGQQVSWKPLIDKLVGDGFSRQQMQQLFQGVTFTPDAMGHKMHSLYTRKFGSGLVRDTQMKLDALGYQTGGADGHIGPKTRAAIRGFQMEHGLKVTGLASEELLQFIKQNGRRAPAGYTPPKPPRDAGPPIYRSVYTPERLAEALEFYRRHRPLLEEVQREYGIPPEIAVGLLTVETRVGKFLGDQQAFQTLASMARAWDPELFADTFTRETPQGSRLDWLRKRTVQKSNWAYSELKALIRYAENKGADPRTLPGSIYGAIGISQFMPSNALRFGVDGDEDGVINLFDVEDALHSMGNYLVNHGWRGAATTERQQRKALFRYNHSTIYVNTIMAVAKYVRQNAR